MRLSQTTGRLGGSCDSLASSDGEDWHGVPELPGGGAGRKALLHGMRSAHADAMSLLWQSQPAKG
jgi:hypothetical protein